MSDFVVFNVLLWIQVESNIKRNGSVYIWFAYFLSLYISTTEVA